MLYHYHGLERLSRGFPKGLGLCGLLARVPPTLSLSWTSPKDCPGPTNSKVHLRISAQSLQTNSCLGWLLRVAKAPTNGQPARFNYLKQQEFYAKQITPFLKTHAIQQQLVVLRNSNIIPKLNAFLLSIDHERKEKFRGSFLSESNWGLLVEDMRVAGELLDSWATCGSF